MIFPETLLEKIPKMKLVHLRHLSVNKYNKSSEKKLLNYHFQNKNLKDFKKRLM